MWRPQKSLRRPHLGSRPTVWRTLPYYIRLDKNNYKESFHFLSFSKNTFQLQQFIEANSTPLPSSTGCRFCKMFRHPKTDGNHVLPFLIQLLFPLNPLSFHTSTACICRCGSLKVLLSTQNLSLKPNNDSTHVVFTKRFRYCSQIFTFSFPNSLRLLSVLLHSLRFSCLLCGLLLWSRAESLLR